MKAFTFALALCIGACSGARTPAPPSQAPSSTPTAATAFTPGGIGSMEARNVRGDTSRVTLRSLRLVAKQLGDMAEVEAVHTFESDADSVLEGTFCFPMPDGALLTGLAMLIDGKMVQGELVEREKARKAYESVLDSMQDPALLEWEHGSIFKMRVFPIEPKQPKTVTIRYLTPLRRSADGLALVQAVRSAAGNEPLALLDIDWQGKRVLHETNLAPGREISVPAEPASAVLQERRPDASFAVVRVSPDWRKLPQAHKPVPKNWFVVVDTSRSALEELPRELEALPRLLGALPPGSRFQMLTSDVDVRVSPRGLVQPTPETIADALAFVQSAGADGASDLGRALSSVGKLAASMPDTALLYLGDCEPTWGVTNQQELLALSARELPHTAFHGLMFGASINDDLAAELAAQHGGRRARVLRAEDVTAYAKTLPIGLPTLDGVEVKTTAGNELLTSGPLSLEPGRDLWLLVKAPAGRDPLLGLSVKAKLGQQTLDLMPHVPPQDTRGLTQRFGAARVRQLEKAGKPGPEIVAASLDYGVMSKLTSFLVLESEEAYARFAIERKQAQAADAPRVTGANLESNDGSDISAERIQPGDPEISIDAERDALSVKVEFPWGELKSAIWDHDARGGRGAWLVRFLVARDTPEGDYEARALVQHRDGRVELQRVRYSVDNTAPQLAVELRHAAHHAEMMEILVTQPGLGMLSDLKRVELRTPQGTVHRLVAIRWGTFRALVPRRELTRGTLRVVGFDTALNHSVKELVLP